jgi:hypothetical protein
VALIKVDVDGFEAPAIKVAPQIACIALLHEMQQGMLASIRRGAVTQLVFGIVRACVRVSEI